MGCEESNLQWTSSQSRRGVEGGELAMYKHSIQGNGNTPSAFITQQMRSCNMDHLTPAYRKEIVLAQIYHKMVKDDS